MKLLEGDLLSQVTMSDRSGTVIYNITLMLNILQAICHSFFEEKNVEKLVVNKPQ